MSAAIVSYESFKAKREQRPQEYFAYIDLLQEAYPELIKAIEEEWSNGLLKRCSQ